MESLNKEDFEWINKNVKENDMENGTKKIQWAIFSPDRSESIVIRTDDKEEALDLSQWAKGVLPSEKPFPDDEGDYAHPVSATQKKTPVCPYHKKIMKLRKGPYGEFYSCGSKNPDGSWCQYRPNGENL